ncbi:MAG: HNH endonuclease [Chitinophagaceae bacterium]|nr:HNH endonuclease [Chitinophagaceae bacterium]
MTPKNYKYQDIADRVQELYLTVPLKTLARKLGVSQITVRRSLKYLKLTIPEALAQERKQKGMFRKGMAPANKGKKMSPELKQRVAHTFFQKGHKPHNTKYDGCITLRKKWNGKQYYFIRIGEKKWELLHRHIWELNYGAIPKGMNVVFKDGNPLNVQLDNLELIIKSENLKRNRAAFLSQTKEVRDVKQLINKINDTIKKKRKLYEKQHTTRAEQQPV